MIKCQVIIVSKTFEGLLLLDQHRCVTDVLKEELDGLVHALALKTLTPAKWKEKEGNVVHKTPPCRGFGGGGKFTEDLMKKNNS